MEIYLLYITTSIISHIFFTSFIAQSFFLTEHAIKFVIDAICQFVPLKSHLIFIKLKAKNLCQLVTRSLKLEICYSLIVGKPTFHTL